MPLMTRLNVLFVLVLPVLSFHTLAQNARKVFEISSPAVVVVRTSDGRSQGSGVAFANISEPTSQTAIVTNCHVVKGRKSAVVSRQSARQVGDVILCDELRDVAILLIAGVHPIASSRDTRLAVGERVYAIGAPQGLELSISEGIISQLRERPAGKVSLIQTTAAISPGSSGGGLFDSSGKILGITTLQLKEGQQLNFAVPFQFVTEALESAISVGPDDLSPSTSSTVDGSRSSACEWKYFANNQKARYFLDRCKVAAKGDLKSVMVLIDFEVPQILKDGTEFRSNKAIQILDCANRQWHVVGVVSYSGQMASGQVVNRLSMLGKAPVWQTIRADTIFSLLMNEVC